ncbi:hypothetical protein A3H16_03205 [Candidatus Kaiserbacteria bacterium RIFCSPLOWO2_12_FULL_53_8]|uniref:PIN domain-containing protein n=1 Tax=Candidatus Kaiserbacteria bacterium RIFCSPLOWO2_12_FULL_53_8 TaxID=1798529 RepID=A0A1F6FYJ0_9BACT|nr:MAG: hypothetical protein A3H16_03205 [Candidatus Kaiserbacteria bacterium RIFCSPLOWO2_12_FULL_53_8]
MSSLTLDASVALAWLFEDENNEYARKVMRAASSRTMIVPPIWPLEVGNALLVAERQKRITRVQADDSLETLAGLEIIVDPGIVDASCKDLCVLARNFCLTTYDASYLSLAMRENTSLATLDRKLRLAAKEAGVALFE